MHRIRYCPPPCSSARPNRHGASLSRGESPRRWRRRFARAASRSERKEPAKTAARRPERGETSIRRHPPVTLRLLPHHENGKRIRQHGCAATTATALLLRVLGCIGGRGRRWPVLCSDQQDVVRLAVQRQGFGARHGLQVLFHHEAGRAVFLDDTERAITVGDRKSTRLNSS